MKAGSKDFYNARHDLMNPQEADLEEAGADCRSLVISYQVVQLSRDQLL